MLPDLETARLHLSEMALTDAPALQAVLAGEDQWRYQAVEREDMSDWGMRVGKYLEHRGADDRRRLFVYVARNKSTGDLIGQTSLSRSHPAIASLGFGVGGKYAGAGFATEMAEGLIGFGFDCIGLNRIEADVAVENGPSIRVMHKIGMSHEGTARACVWAQNKWWTEERFAMLARDRRE